MVETYQQFQQAKPVQMEGPIEAVTIRRLGVSSTALMLSMIMLFFGLVFGIIFGIVYAVNGEVDMSFLGDSTVEFFSGVGVYLALIIPFAFLIFGFILGAVVALFYNLSAKMIKGVKLYS